jgi:hypothetical protein
VAPAALILGLVAIEIILVRLHNFVFLAYGWGAFAALFLRLRYHRTPETIRDMMDFPSVVPQFPVQITIYNATGKAGQDIGVITFDEDILHFEGRQIAFDLPSGWSDPVYTARNRKSSTFSHGPYEISWSIGDQTGKLRINSFRSVSGSTTEFAPAFRTAFGTWRAATPNYHPKITLPPMLSRNQSELSLNQTTNPRVTR